MQTAILDTHVHLWDPARFEMPWITGDPVLDQRYDLDRFDTAIAGTTVAAVVYVQVEVAPPLALLEAEEVVRLARIDPRIRAMVPWAPLEFGRRAEPFIERLLSLGPLTTSVRRLIQDEPDPEFCLQPRFVEGIRMLASHDLGFDLCVRHHQLPAVTRLVDLAPHVRFVLDHVGKPDIRGASIDPWRQQIRDLARRDNVVCKLSGMVTEADHAGWKPDDLRPFVETVLDAFGPSRTMFGGDWPVVLLASSYRGWLDTAFELTASLSPSEQWSIFWETGSSFYRCTIQRPST